MDRLTRERKSEIQGKKEEPKNFQLNFWRIVEKLPFFCGKQFGKENCIVFERKAKQFVLFERTKLVKTDKKELTSMKILFKL